MLSPARMAWAINGPTTGARAACSAPTTADQTPLASQRRSWPVNPIASVNSSRTTPLIQFISRGYLYAAWRYTCAMCMTAMRIMADAPKKCIPRSTLPSGACSVMYLRLSKASPPEGTYASASPIPVTTCIMKQQSAALPKTYHQRASRGTMCFINGPIVSDAPVRSSMNRQVAANADLNMAPYLESLGLERGQGDRARLNLHLPVIHADGVSGKRFGRWSGGDGAVLVVDPAVARTHEELGAVDPADRASQVAAVDAEGDEVALAHAPQPRRGLGGDPGPRKRRRVGEVDLDGLPDFERVDTADRAPSRLGGPHEWGEDEADHRNSGQQGDGAGGGDRNAGEKPTPGDLGLRAR